MTPKQERTSDENFKLKVKQKNYRALQISKTAEVLFRRVGRLHESYNIKISFHEFSPVIDYITLNLS